MYLVNFPNIRVKKYNSGYVVEIQKKTWYGKKYWVHIISVSGMTHRPWFFKTEEAAIKEAECIFGICLTISVYDD